MLRLAILSDTHGQVDDRGIATRCRQRPVGGRVAGAIEGLRCLVGQVHDAHRAGATVGGGQPALIGSPVLPGHAAAGAQATNHRAPHKARQVVAACDVGDGPRGPLPHRLPVGRPPLDPVLGVDDEHVTIGVGAQAARCLQLAQRRVDCAPRLEVAAQVANAVQASPTEPGPRLALINLYLSNKDAKKAVAAGQDAITALPDNIGILDALARAQQAAGDNNQALTTYGKIVGLMPGSPQPYLRMADINVAAKNKEAAIQNLRKALELKPDLLAAQRGLIMLYLDAQNIPDAQKIVREVKQQRPKEPAGFLFEGDISASRKAWPEAVAAYRAGLKQAPSTELAVKVYAALYAGGNGAEAEKFATGWLNDHAQDGRFRLAMAESATARKDFSTAVKHYQTLLQAQPNNPMILNNVAWALGQLKDARALDYAEKALRLAPSQPAIMETVASLVAEKGDTTRALELLQKATSLAPASNDLKLSTARVMIKAGKKAEAQKILAELGKLGDKYAAQADVTRLLKEIGN